MDIWGECFKSTPETQAKVLLRTWMFVFREEQRSQSGWNGESEWGKYWMRSESVQQQNSCRIFQNYHYFVWSFKLLFSPINKSLNLSSRITSILFAAFSRERILKYKSRNVLYLFSIISNFYTDTKGYT